MRDSVLELDSREQIYCSGMLHDEREQSGERLVHATNEPGSPGVGDEITDVERWDGGSRVSIVPGRSKHKNTIGWKLRDARSPAAGGAKLTY